MDDALLYAFSWLAVAGVAVVAWLATRDGIAGWVGRGGLAVLAVAATALAFVLAQSGTPNGSIAAAVVGVGAFLFALFAIGFWSAFLLSVRRWWRARGSPRDETKARAARRTADLGLALSLVACAAGFVFGLFRAEQARAPHAHGVADARLAADGRRAWSLGVDGELLAWRLVALPGPRSGLSSPSPFRVEQRHRLPPSGTASLVVANDGTRVATLAGRTLRVHALAPAGGAAAAVASVEDVSAVAAVGDGFVVASARGLGWVGSASGDRAPLPWPRAVVALASNARGDVVFADDSGGLVRVSADGTDPLGHVPGRVRALAFDRAGDQLLVLADKSALAVELRTGASAPLGTELAELATGFDGTRMLLCHRAGVSCTRLDLADGSRGAAFSGVMKEYARVEGAPGTALVVGPDSLYLQALGADGQGYGGAFLRDARF